MIFLISLLNDTTFHYKSATKSVILSAVIPGGGQFYNGKKLKGIIISTLDISSLSLFTYNVYQYKKTNLEDYYWLAIGYFITFIGVKMFSMFDAYVDTKFINSKKSYEEIRQKVILNQ